ncbi:MAG TPA: peptidylprolyl isomerase, partial [Candidatus Sumerlaeota bacterium]|nr:peptidylprolyl isomerase [Candidatus Sumerlaeota bacterium]
AEAIWVEHVIKPEVTVDPTDVDRYYLSHPERYLQRRQAQVRYIFRTVPDMSQALAREAVRDELEALRARIEKGELTFDEAARQFSDAPSAAEGGLLPAFFDNTYFAEFEEESFKLSEPGRMSPVFSGPGGFYLVQLVHQQRPRNIPIEAVRDQIAEQLQYDLIASYYNFELARIQRRRYVRNHAPWFEYMNFSAPLARVDRATLSRQQFFRFYGNPIDPFFLVNWPAVVGGIGHWVEGETVMQELEDAGLANHPWIARARQIATIERKAQHVIAVSVPPATYSSGDVALETLKQNPEFLASLRSLYLVRISIAPRDPAGMTPTELRFAGNTVHQISQSLAQGILPTEPQSINLADWRASLMQTLADQGLTLDSTPPDAPEVLVVTGGATPIEFTIPAPPTPVRFALAELENAIAATRWTEVDVAVEPFGWRDTVPGSGWDRLFLYVQPGQVSQPTRLGSITERYLVLDERPLDVTPWLERPLHLQSLAFQAGAHDIIAATQRELLQSGSVQLAWSPTPAAEPPADTATLPDNPPPAPDFERIELPPPPPADAVQPPQDLAPFDIVIDDPEQTDTLESPPE